MPQVEVTVSAVLKENQKDTECTATFGPLVFKDNTIVEYDAAKRLVLTKGKEVSVDVTNLSAPNKILGIEVVQGQSMGSKFKLRLRKASSEGTDIEVSRFFFAELSNIERIAMLNEQDENVTVLVFIVTRA